MCACGLLCSTWLAGIIRCKCDEWFRREAERERPSQIPPSKTQHNTTSHSFTFQAAVHIQNNSSSEIHKGGRGTRRKCEIEFGSVFSYNCFSSYVRTQHVSFCMFSIHSYQSFSRAQNKHKSNRWSRGDKQLAQPLMDTQKHASICILSTHTTQGTS